MKILALCVGLVATSFPQQSFGQNRFLCDGLSSAQRAGIVTLVLRNENEATWASKLQRFTNELDNFLNTNRTTSLYTFNSTIASTVEVQVGDRTDLRLYLFVTVNPVGGTFPAGQLVVELRDAQLAMLIRASVYYTTDSVRVESPSGCSVALTTQDEAEPEKEKDWKLIGIIIAVGATVLLTSIIIVVMSNRATRRTQSEDMKYVPKIDQVPQTMITPPTPASYMSGVQPLDTVSAIPPSPMIATSLVVDLGENYHETTMHTHL